MSIMIFNQSLRTISEFGKQHISIPCHRMKALQNGLKERGSDRILNNLSADDRGAFLNDIIQRLTDVYPTQKNGEIIFRFPRLLFTAQK